jgi:chaperonin GroES
MNIRPMYDRVIVRKDEVETTTTSGLIIPGHAADKPSRGEILAVGKGTRSSNGDIIPLDVNVGDTILFGKEVGQEIKTDDGEKLVVMKEYDIVAIVATTD